MKRLLRESERSLLVRRVRSLTRTGAQILEEVSALFELDGDALRILVHGDGRDSADDIAADLCGDEPLIAHIAQAINLEFGLEVRVIIVPAAEQENPEPAAEEDAGSARAAGGQGNAEATGHRQQNSTRIVADPS